MGYAAKPSNYTYLKELRKSKTASLKPCPYLRDSAVLRYYQVVGSLHLMMLSRMLLGDSAGLGKTLELIAAYAYCLVKSPTLKLLVAAPKSAVDQWKEEFEKFSQNISVHVLTNEYALSLDGHVHGRPKDLKRRGIKYKRYTGFKARKLQYDRVDAQVLVSTYYPIKEDYVFLVENRGPNFMVTYDECFHYHTPVTLEDGTTELIGKIVRQRKNVRVLSYNAEKNIIEPQSIVNYFANPAESWMKVKGRLSNSVVCTPSHSFYTEEGKKAAVDLVPGEKIYGYTEKISDVQWQVILGSLIGDGALRHTRRFLQGKTTGVRLMQSEKRLQYLMHKAYILADHLQSIPRQKSGWNRRHMWTLNTKPSPLITEKIRALQIVDRSGRKCVTPQWLQALDPMGLAFWYCDDGSYSGGALSLNTQGFGKNENRLIVNHMLKVYGVKLLLVDDKRKNLTSLRANSADSLKFRQIIAPYVPCSMAYKMGEISCGSFWETYKPTGLEWEQYEDTVEYCTPFTFSSNTFSKYKYNIEVEGNHNYFAGGMLVSNCQEFKNDKTKAFFGATQVAEKAKRVYGLSATPIKNKLEEAYNIYRVLVPGLFGGRTKFMQTYTIRKKMTIFRGGKKRRFNKIVGYQNLAQFKETIDPYFLVRRTREVADELPNLMSKKVVLEMSGAQDRLYKQALSGELYQRIIRDKYFKFQEHMSTTLTPSDKETEEMIKLQKRYDESLTKEGLQKNKIAALVFCQLVSNGPAWLNEEGESSKETEFHRLFNQELSTEKVIVFTRFRSGIKHLEKILDELEMKHVKITGDMDNDDRNSSRQIFQAEDNDTNIIFITFAGSAALNLQAANVILFYDTPWSYGDLYQTIGRAQRIGSIYEHIHLIHMINKKSIDEHVIEILESKKHLINDIMGDIAAGAIEFKDAVMFKEDESDVGALFTAVFGKAA